MSDNAKFVLFLVALWIKAIILFVKAVLIVTVLSIVGCRNAEPSFAEINYAAYAGYDNARSLPHYAFCTYYSSDKESIICIHRVNPYFFRSQNVLRAWCPTRKLGKCTPLPDLD